MTKQDITVTRHTDTITIQYLNGMRVVDSITIDMKTADKLVRLLEQELQEYDTGLAAS